MLYRQTQFFTKFFLILHPLFFISCFSTPKNEPFTFNKEDPVFQKTVFIEKKTFEFLPYTQDNWKIIRQQVEYKDGFYLSSISSIWILDEYFPVELITLNNFTPEDFEVARYFEGDKISLRSTDTFIPVTEIFATGNEVNKINACNKDEFQMLGRIYSNFKYTGVSYKDTDLEKKPWFSFGNIVCAKILH